MFREKDLSKISSHEADESSNKPVSQSASGQNPDERIGFSDKDLDLLAQNPFNSKGKGVALENSCSEQKLVVRDFLQLNEHKGSSSKREMENEIGRERDSKDKKAKMETLDLSLALPNVSLSLNPSNPLQSLAISNNITQTTCSNDFTAASLSCSYSHPFSHNPSCSLTRNSTENHEHSIWHCGEGTNGSVHSRFRPAGDGNSLSGHFGGLAHNLINGGRIFNKESSNSLYKPASSDNASFPSELPARPNLGTVFGDSRGISGLKFSRAAKIVVQCISEPIPTVSQILQELTDESVELTKEYLRNLTSAPEGKDELNTLQNQLQGRSDFTRENLVKCHKLHMEILVAIKFGLGDFVSKESKVPTAELVEIFLLTRCRNVNCKSLLPVDDCECKICSTKKGFCSQCMCPICLKFDCASNTCSWVGCDVCSHWCHAACGISKNLIRAGPSLKGPFGTSEMQFHCIGCGHASEMLGFVKDVFLYCAKAWSAETLMKELDCVRKIFKGSEDVRGKALYLKAQETIYRLERGATSPSYACDVILHFFNSTGSRSSLSAQKDTVSSQTGRSNETVPFASTNLLSPSASTLLSNMLPPAHLHQSAAKSSSSKYNGGLESLEGVVRIKEAEARMYQARADEARKEAEGYRELGRVRLEKLDQEYAGKVAELRLKETEDRRRKKLEELKILEGAHCDYYNMKLRMQAEIAGLLERMEATKQAV